MSELREMFASPWIIVGFAGQLVFSARFIIQWIVSERHKRSVVPLCFWYLSLAGSTLLLVYAIGRRDPVIFLGQAFGSVIYIRNLVLFSRPVQTGIEQQETG